MKKYLGIWMDHRSANIMEYKIDAIETNIIDSKFTKEEKSESLGKSENIMHNKEQQKQSEFYQNLGAIIRNYDEVLLFGPTDAKLELFNILRADTHFEKVNIKIEQADKMTENQQHSFVKKHFEKK
ncbi:MAG: hypothetical protein KA347_01175 [Bacteroidia bacterium]|jgi:hypothetical protein|nr:hypothetical protein [Bacteroidota bacterium]MBP6511258.1 hypothetical protein [Bacteroidia bacterium]MBP7243961.1 hypothetical protein [Bacteroidia bacterium]